MLLSILLVTALVILIYEYLIFHFNYWKKLGVIFPKPKLIFGNFSDSISRKIHITDDLTKIYLDFKGLANFVGIFQFRTPRILILEPELVKEVLIRQFKNFHDNEFSKLIDYKSDPIFARNPFFARGSEWKELRNEISPAFSANRTRVIYPMVEDVCHRLSKFIHQEMHGPIEARTLAKNFTLETAATCVFGIEAGAFHKNETELKKMANRFFQSPPISTIINFLLVSSFPSLKNILKIQFIPDDVSKFFFNLIQQAVDHRELNTSISGDFLEFVSTLKKKKGLTSYDISGHAITFFSDGLETSAILISLALYELAKNEKIQEKLRNEIKMSRKSDQNSFEIPHSLEYLDQVVNETIRLHPPFTYMSKECTEDTELEYRNGKYVKITKGTNVYIPLYQIQRDAEYYPKPLEFNPERFSNGTKDFKEKGIFLTFGDGPRICLGIRFAIMQTKSAIYEVISNFKISVNKKTEQNLVIDPAEFSNVKRGGLWLDFSPVKT